MLSPSNGEVSIPRDLKVTLHGNSATIFWWLSRDTPEVRRFELKCQLQDAAGGPMLEATYSISGFRRSFHIPALQPCYR
ncbi:hypothetical protein MAR_004613 [Mya arenaria]|uniref:Uncharacterized protein n=1 Tax=Mya arenaria TaxID=6604 RepID=A0ABY7EX30_MYAAR|nr:hypothetical protein MAR_004613 [Mya arenaria]